VIHGVNRVQRQAAVAMTGVLRTAPTDMVEVYAGLPPAAIHITKIQLAAVTRIATLPALHPMTKVARRAARTSVKRHQAPIHGLMDLLGVDPSMVEDIPVVREWVLPRGWVEVNTDTSKEEALAREQEQEAEVRIYTDGSVIGGKVGAAAVLYRGFRPVRTARHHLGEDKNYSIYEAELVAQILGLRLL
ncbi:hypothetical protein FA15DRAFT_561605, partial [Coprinopsis marcescibilis]